MQYKWAILLMLLSFVPIIAWPYLTVATDTMVIGEDLNNTILLFFSLLPFIVAIIVNWRVFTIGLGLNFEEKRILKSGRHAIGIVEYLGESSEGATITVNQQPYLNLRLEVHDGTHKPYKVSFDTIIPRATVPQFQPGAVIPLRADPKDPQKVVIAWSDELDQKLLNKIRKI